MFAGPWSAHKLHQRHMGNNSTPPASRRSCRSPPASRRSCRGATATRPRPTAPRRRRPTASRRPSRRRRPIKDAEDRGAAASGARTPGRARPRSSPRSASPVEAPPPPPLSPSTDASNKILTRTTSATTACLNDYEAQWIAMATTRKMSVDNAEGSWRPSALIRRSATRASCGGTRRRSTTASSRRPGAAATDLFVHASEVTEPSKSGRQGLLRHRERRGRSAATKVEVLERAPPPPPRVFTPVAFGGQQAGFCALPAVRLRRRGPKSVPVFS